MDETYKPLNELIDSSGFKLNYIADQMGISRIRLYQIRENPNLMSIDQMEKFAEILNVDFSVIHEIRKQYSDEIKNHNQGA